ncbi:glycosyltransferase [Elizabethkingia sp. S0634]|uniref:glycosyltransferase family 2 protein n=1 Tax=Elizabethkingia sp. S0634 TaxID=2957806 RepID=UPI00209FEB43|nr:glycosyltransferase family 2 protein [Elizabethkingia sp. S0634]MCP1252931.1 glycosyltransferase [Elizabethkingia sp. S0634]
MEYKVSLIIPVYKVESYIEKCARSVFEQSLLSLQIIFIDDCTQDNSIEILKNVLKDYPHRIADTSFLQNEQNKGASVSRNIGLEIAKGEYIAFCDADDWTDKSTLEEMYETISSDNADIIWTDFYYTSPSNEILKNQSVTEKKEKCIKALMSEEMHGALWNKMYNRNLFFENGIRFPEGRDMWEDLCTNIQLFHFTKKVTYLPRAFYHYIQYNANSIGSSTLNEKKLSDIIENTDTIESFLTEKKVSHLYEKEMFFLKLAAKQNLLFTCDKKNFEKWRSIYPESNRYIMKFKALPSHLRLIGWAVTYGIWPLVDLWIYLKRNKNKK